MQQTLAYFDSPKPRILAHRGLVDEFGVENTLASFAAASHVGLTHVESDVQATRDGVAVLFHDATLFRFTKSNRKISDFTLAELKTIDIGFGNRIPTLQEALVRFPRLRFNLDIKSANASAPAAAVINELSAHDRVLITSFSESRRRRTIGLLNKPVASSASSQLVLRLYAASMLGLKWLMPKPEILGQIQALQIPTSQGTLRFDSVKFIAKMHSLGLELHYWTINTDFEMRRLIKLGADGIVTDASELAIATLRKP